MTLHYDIFSLPVELTIYIYSTLFTITKNGSNKKKQKPSYEIYESKTYHV